MSNLSNNATPFAWKLLYIDSPEIAGYIAPNKQTNGKPAWATGCNIYRRKQGETDYTLTPSPPSPYVDTIAGTAVNVSYKVALSSVRAPDIGDSSPEQTVVAGG